MCSTRQNPCHQRRRRQPLRSRRCRPKRPRFASISRSCFATIITRKSANDAPNRVAHLISRSEGRSRAAITTRTLTTERNNSRANNGRTATTPTTTKTSLSCSFGERTNAAQSSCCRSTTMGNRRNENLIVVRFGKYVYLFSAICAGLRDGSCR